VRALFDHLGYRADDTKQLLLDAPGTTEWHALDLVRVDTGQVVEGVAATFAGAVAGWSLGPWWTVDVTTLSEPGRYALRWATATGAGQTEAFDIEPPSSDRSEVVSDIAHYIKGQRCSGIWDAADRVAPRAGDGLRRDVHGGWYDASGDHSKYLSHLSYTNHMNPQQAPLTVWALAHAWHLGGGDGMAPLLRERLRDEALHGADWLVRMLDPDGFWYMTVFDRWTKDPEQRMLCSYRTQLGEIGDDYQAGWRQGGGMAAAALAVASTLGPGGEHSPAEYLEAATAGFEHLRAHGSEYLDDGVENVIDDTCALLAACELHAAGERRTSVIEELEYRADRLLARRRATDDHVWIAADDAGDRSWFHASDEGLPLVAMLLAAGVTGGDRATQLDALAGELVAAQLRLGGSLANPFGYPPHWVRVDGRPGRTQWFYPHVNPSGYWWQGENARLASLAAAARMWAGRHRDDPIAGEARSAATRWLSWITGRNPFDACMLHGRGRNNPPYEPGFPNAPGGVCNGVTSGFDDEADIALRPVPQVADRTQSWRWGEQWMPHATWLLYAIMVDG
jgi:hypothetical protein